MSLHWFLKLFSLPATPSKSDFARNISSNWVQNPFRRDFERNRFRFRSDVAKPLNDSKYQTAKMFSFMN